MKHLRRLVLLILIMIKTSRLVIQTYKEVYNNFIKREDEVLNRVKSMIEADKVIKTSYIHEPKDYDEKIKKRFRYQAQQMERLNNGKFKYRKIL